MQLFCSLSNCILLIFTALLLCSMAIGSVHELYSEFALPAYLSHVSDP